MNYKLIYYITHYLWLFQLLFNLILIIKPILFINTSSMFEQFQEKAGKNGINALGAGLWAKYFYLYRDKMWKEQRTKFIFVITESNLIEMIKSVDHGFSIEFTPIYVKKSKPKENIITKKLILSTNNDDNK